MVVSENSYKPEFNLLDDAYLGSKSLLLSKLDYLANMSQKEKNGIIVGIQKNKYCTIISAIHTID